MHDTDGISSHRRVKNSTLLRSRVEFQVKSFCFFHCLLDRGHFRPINHIFIVFSNELTGKNNRAYGFNAGDPLRMQTEAVSQKAVMKIIIRHKRDAAIAGKRW